jgi:hypothetical protein
VYVDGELLAVVVYRKGAGHRGHADADARQKGGRGCGVVKYVRNRGGRR